MWRHTIVGELKGSSCHHASVMEPMPSRSKIPDGFARQCGGAARAGGAFFKVHVRGHATVPTDEQTPQTDG